MNKVSLSLPSVYLQWMILNSLTEGLNEPFRNEKKCLLDYMSSASNTTDYVFRNLLVISLGLFKALDYFAKERLVHRDVKRNNFV